MTPVRYNRPLESVVAYSPGLTGFRSNRVVSPSRLKRAVLTPPLVLMANARVWVLMGTSVGACGAKANVGGIGTCSATVGKTRGVGVGGWISGVVVPGTGVTIPKSAMVASAVIKVGVTSSVGGVWNCANCSGDKVCVAVGRGSAVKVASTGRGVKVGMVGSGGRVGVDVGNGVKVAVGVTDGSGVWVAVAVGVIVGVLDGRIGVKVGGRVAVGVGGGVVAVAVAVGVLVGVLLGVCVRVGVWLGVAVGAFVLVAVGVCVGVFVGVAVAVGV